ncbi:MAG: hypothetical protein ACLUE2_09905 [Bacteroides cellulosilyticus]
MKSVRCCKSVTGVARIYGLRNAEANELLEFDNGIKAIVMNLEEDNVGAVLLGSTDKIKEGYVVKRTKANCFHYGGRGYAGTCYRSLWEHHWMVRDSLVESCAKCLWNVKRRALSFVSL